MLSDLLGRIRSGESRKQLAQIYGETPYRILKLRDQATRLEVRRTTTGPLAALGAYARNSLLAAGLRTPEQVKEALDAGTLGRIALLGPQRIEEIRVWLESRREAA